MKALGEEDGVGSGFQLVLKLKLHCVDILVGMVQKETL